MTFKIVFLSFLIFGIPMSLLGAGIVEGLTWRGWEYCPQIGTSLLAAWFLVLGTRIGLEIVPKMAKWGRPHA